MKWTCAALLASAGLLMAQGDDELGLPQLDAPVPDPVPASGYFMQDGVVYALIGDRAVPLDREVRMRVTPGKIIGFDGRPLRLPPGMMYLESGAFAPLPVPEPAPPRATLQAGQPTTPAATGAVAVEASKQPVAQPVVPNVSLTASGISQPANTPLYPVEPNPPASPATQVTAVPHTSPATIPPPQPAFAAPFRPDRTGPRMDVERPVDRTRPESSPYHAYFDITTQGPNEPRQPDPTRPGTDYTRYRDRTMPGPDDYRWRDRTMQGPDGQRPPDPTRRSR